MELTEVIISKRFVSVCQCIITAFTLKRGALCFYNFTSKEQKVLIVTIPLLSLLFFFLLKRMLVSYLRRCRDLTREEPFFFLAALPLLFHLKYVKSVKFWLFYLLFIAVLFSFQKKLRNTALSSRRGYEFVAERIESTSIPFLKLSFFLLTALACTCTFKDPLLPMMTESIGGLLYTFGTAWYTEFSLNMELVALAEDLFQRQNLARLQKSDSTSVYFRVMQFSGHRCYALVLFFLPVLFLDWDSSWKTILGVLLYALITSMFLTERMMRSSSGEKEMGRPSLLSRTATFLTLLLTLTLLLSAYLSFLLLSTLTHLPPSDFSFFSGCIAAILILDYLTRLHLSQTETMITCYMVARVKNLEPIQEVGYFEEELGGECFEGVKKEYLGNAKADISLTLFEDWNRELYRV